MPARREGWFNWDDGDSPRPLSELGDDMSALPNLAPLLGQIDHHTAWFLSAILWRLLRPIYRLYAGVVEEIAPTISEGVNAEIAGWFASRRRRAEGHPLQRHQYSHGNSSKVMHRPGN